MKKKVWIIFLLFIMVACHPEINNEVTVPIDNIDFSSAKKANLKDLLSDVSTNYVLLKNTNEDQMFGRIDKIIIKQGRIYIADNRMRSLVIYDENGLGVSKVGTVGQGPKEFLNLADFDVDSLGNIYILDGRLDKLLKYDNNLVCMKETKLPFEADILKVLGNSKVLYGLSSWNKREAEGSKIVLADTTFGGFRKYFEYTDAVDPAYWISGYMFADTPNFVAYNQTVSDDIYIFDHQGELKKILRFNFGNENVPDKDKVDIERNLRNYDNYIMLRKILAVTDKYIVGFVWEHRQKKMFVFDYIQNVCYMGDVISDYDYRIGCGFCAEGIISYMDSESELYPDSVNEHLRNEGVALKIQSVN